MATIVTGTRKFHINSAAYATKKDATTGITTAEVIETTGSLWDTVGTVDFRTKPGTKSAKQYRAVTVAGQESEWVKSRELAVEALAGMTA